MPSECRAPNPVLGAVRVKGDPGAHRRRVRSRAERAPAVRGGSGVLATGVRAASAASQPWPRSASVRASIAGSGTPAAARRARELLAALGIVEPARRILRGRYEGGRSLGCLADRGLVLVLELLDGCERGDLGRVKAAAVADLLADPVGGVVEDRRGRARWSGSRQLLASCHMSAMSCGRGGLPPGRRRTPAAGAAVASSRSASIRACTVRVACSLSRWPARSLAGGRRSRVVRRSRRRRARAAAGARPPRRSRLRARASLPASCGLVGDWLIAGC